MGFRSTLAAQHYAPRFWPQWFRDKYTELISEDATLSLGTSSKTWGWPDLAVDIQRALTETGFFDREVASFVYVWLHDCGGVTRVQVNRHTILVTYPTEWAIYDGVDGDSVHGDGCGGDCSDPRA